jgi:crotonobetainyl-CoA:carnitine CoA-transferase CaiB-like acyl-CoA transferase
MAEDAPGQALSGIRVLAFEVSVSAPHCSRMLGEMGAEVTKIEKPGEGDLVRHWDSAVRGLASPLVWLNGNKRSLAIDAKTRGPEVIRTLAGWLMCSSRPHRGGGTARPGAAACA